MAVRVEIHGEDKEQVNEWIRFGMKVAIQGILHPIEYSKVLIQVSLLHKKFAKINFTQFSDWLRADSTVSHKDFIWQARTRTSERVSIW